jgi:hypothetical protein
MATTCDAGIRSPHLCGESSAQRDHTQALPIAACPTGRFRQSSTLVNSEEM